MDPFPPSRAEAVRLAREHGEGLGEKVRPEGSQRKLQPVVDKFFYSLAANSIETQRLGLWWANRMLATNRPLEEKLTLFWHGHFATGENKTRDYRMMLRQNEMFRSHAAGNLHELLVGILKDPGMLVYLDNGENIKSHPNENFGRELLELFSMGVGNYSERDVREAARSFTGWTNNVLEFKFDADQHDAGQKTFLGQTGPFNGEDIIDIILKQPVTAEFVSAKLYRFFVRDDVSPPVRAGLGRTFRDSGYQVKPLLKQIFLSRDFYSDAATATQIKSPVQLVVSTYKKLGLREVPTIPDFGRMTSGLGQALFDPPNVAGWAGGRTWITPSTLLQRGNLFREVLFPNVKGFRPPDRSLSATDQGVGERLARGMDITEATKENDAPREHDGGVEHDGRPRRGLQHAVRRLQRRPDRVRADQTDSSTPGGDRADRDDHSGWRRHGRQGRRSFRPPVPVREACGKRSRGARRVSAREDRIERRATRRQARRIAARIAVSRAQHARVSAWIRMAPSLQAADFGLTLAPEADRERLYVPNTHRLRLLASRISRARPVRRSASVPPSR